MVANSDIIGVGSLAGWSRPQIMEEFNEIVRAAEAGDRSIDEWDSMRQTLSKLYTGTSDIRFSKLARLFLFGRFHTLMIDDCYSGNLVEGNADAE